MTCHNYTAVRFEPSDALVKLNELLATLFGRAPMPEPRNRHERRAAKKRGRRR